MQTRLALTKDESLLFFNYSGDAGYPILVDTATDTANEGPYSGGVEDLALSANQEEVAFPGVVYDSGYDVLDFMVLNDREVLNTEWLYRMKISPDGSLVFQPSVSGLDAFNAYSGLLWTRLTFPLKMSQNYDALVSDGMDNVLVAITGTGGNAVTVLDLSGLAVPTPLPFARAHAGLRPLDNPRLRKWTPWGPR